jgi:glucokinase
MITLGTGVGSGIVIDGKIVVGYDGFAGELGHTIIRHDGRLHTGTGMRGSVESYASATGVLNTALEFLNSNPEKASLLRNFPSDSLTSKDIYTCAMQGDDIAKEVFEFTGKILGEALSNFVMFSSPEVIVLFGGLTNAGSLIMTPTKFHLEKNLLKQVRTQAAARARVRKKNADSSSPPCLAFTFSLGSENGSDELPECRQLLLYLLLLI